MTALAAECACRVTTARQAYRNLEHAGDIARAKPNADKLGRIVLADDHTLRAGDHRMGRR
ncbi:hypothetical protein [Actinocrispum wychmicini]|uniref:Uncharacterized protein n=1 Tax=Actinocrispum wychmicini TaxID=1213861 RepID=A0A4R2K8Y5_9PSEU|nr:hypothetical protein [Actinocrispum wychmicini]TCO62855.1 hypothetical protein EV192_102994 [Actinocrispum wychmicini]